MGAKLKSSDSPENTAELVSGGNSVEPPKDWSECQYHYFVGVGKNTEGKKYVDFYFEFETEEVRNLSAECMLAELQENDTDVDTSGVVKMSQSFETMWLVMALKTRLEEGMVACLFHTNNRKTKAQMKTFVEEELSEEMLVAATVMNGTDNDFLDISEEAVKE
jgi:hypothetical protein